MLRKINQINNFTIFYDRSSPNKTNNRNQTFTIIDFHFVFDFETIYEVYTN